jgi:hypothetical protein
MRKLLAIAIVILSVPLAIAACAGGRKGEEAASPPAEEAVAVSPETAAVAPKEAAAPEAEAAAGESFLASQTGGVLPASGPKVIQTASLRLSIAQGRFDETVSRARTIAAGLGGFVASSSASKGSGDRLVRGSLVLRVPADAYARGMAELGRLGKVEARQESGTDVSAEYVDLESRARHLEAVAAQLLELLQRAGDVPSALAVQQQLNAVQLELEQVRGRLRYFDDQAAFATIALEIAERIPVGATGGKDGRWGVVDAWEDGARGFVRVAVGIFVGIATAAPVLLVLAALGLLGRHLWRMRSRAGAGRGATAGTPS